MVQNYKENKKTLLGLLKNLTGIGRGDMRLAMDMVVQRGFIFACVMCVFSGKFWYVAYIIKNISDKIYQVHLQFIDWQI